MVFELIDRIVLKMNIKPTQCYEACNQKYTAMQPERLFCKKGCDNEDPLYYFTFLDKVVAANFATNCASKRSKETKNCGSVNILSLRIFVPGFS